MLSITANTRIFIYGEPTNMRKSFEGLSCIIENHFSDELTSGAFFIFLNRSRDRMKVLYWDSDGLAIWYKRLERGTFHRRDDGKFQISRQEFFMLLEGITPKKIQRRHKVV